MISGLGFFEILVILLMILMFFGSKELPHFIKEGARLIAKMRRYGDKVRRELNDITHLEEPVHVQNYENEINTQKNKIRSVCKKKRDSLSENERKEKSARIVKYLFETDEFKKAGAVMIYASYRTEVQTVECINTMIQMGKRVILPFCRPQSNEMGIAEIKDFSKDVAPGQFNILEPHIELRDNFFKSDLQLIICPGVGFDKFGGRLGYGKGYYDYFLKEVKDKITSVGFAFQCQMLQESIPFDYHDIPVDIIITENGVQKIGKIT